MNLSAGKPFSVDWMAQYRAIVGQGGAPLYLTQILRGVGWATTSFVDSVKSDQELGFVRKGKETESGLWVPSNAFGFCMARPVPINSGQSFFGISDDPAALTWFVDSGVLDNTEEAAEKLDVLVANAARKLRLLARNFEPDGGPLSTMDIMYRRPQLVRHPVQSVESDGTMRWGDFPWSGGVIVIVGKWLLMGAVSGFTGDEDHALATRALVRIGEGLVRRGIKKIVVVDHIS